MASTRDQSASGERSAVTHSSNHSKGHKLGASARKDKQRGVWYGAAYGTHTSMAINQCIDLVTGDPWTISNKIRPRATGQPEHCCCNGSNHRKRSTIDNTRSFSSSLECEMS